MINSNPILIKEEISTKGVLRFAEIYDTLFEELAIFGLSIISNTEEVEDTIQEVFVKLLNKKQSFKSLKELKSYIYTSVRNHLLNKIRSKKVAEKYIERTKHSINIYSDNIEELITQSEVYKEVFDLYQKLPEKCKEVFNLHLEGMSVKQIAEKLDISVNTVKLHKKNALKKLRQNIPPDILLMSILFLSKR